MTFNAQATTTFKDLGKNTALLKGCSLTVRSVDTPGEEPKWTNGEASTSEAFLLLVIVTQEGASRP